MLLQRQQSITWALNWAFQEPVEPPLQDAGRTYYELFFWHPETGTTEPNTKGDILNFEQVKEVQGALREFFEQQLLPIVQRGMARGRSGPIPQLAPENVEWLTMTFKKEGMVRNDKQGRDKVQADFPWLWDEYIYRADVVRLPEPPRYVRDLAAANGKLRVQAHPGQQVDIAAEIIGRVVSILSMPPPLPLTTFLRCKGCGVFFHNRRFKWYCTPKCNKRFNSRIYSGEEGSTLRKLHNEKQALEMQIRYCKKNNKPLRKLPEKLKRAKSRLKAHRQTHTLKKHHFRVNKKAQKAKGRRTD